MRGIFAEIDSELADIEREGAMLDAAVKLFQAGPEDDAAWTWVVVQGIASGVEKIYSGCERVMAIVASQIDQDPIERRDGWHVALLRRVAQPYPGVRDPLISQKTLEEMDVLRSFRHRQRNSYGLILDAGIVIQRATEASAAFADFKADVGRFAKTFPARDTR